MGVLGRIFQVIGWLWVLTGFVGPMFGYSIGSVIPGFIILFVSRILRNQARRIERTNEQEEVMAEAPSNPTPVSVEPPARPKPKARSVDEPDEVQRAQERATEMQRRATDASLRDAEDRQRALEEILMAGQELEESHLEEMVSTEDNVTPLSSAEMIAQARQRWNKKAR